MTNREIDVEVAKTCMGWARYDDPDGDFLPDQGWAAQGAKHGVCPDFSTDPAASKQLRDKMREEGWAFYLAVRPGKGASALFLKDGLRGESTADTEELAVALAALAANGKPVAEAVNA